jgi:DNA-binding transcriptional regulator YdaS (Cro superfamily)
MNPLSEAIRRAGSIAALARGLGEKPQTVSAWKRRAGGRVPAEHCPAIEELTGVPCELLRPDVKWYVLRNKVRSGLDVVLTQAQCLPAEEGLLKGACRAV